jgi:hypothetical protein
MENIESDKGQSHFLIKANVLEEFGEFMDLNEIQETQSIQCGKNDLNGFHVHYVMAIPDYVNVFEEARHVRLASKKEMQDICSQTTLPYKMMNYVVECTR